ncbi:ABC transporter permease [candidate division WWE3 bacterium]|uniref:ABC transporter permease n=1 Tax=candidate division WWE3 bacterium TaxID=2053526 RepID=A0A955LH34_UNCKA|nr:ABC transporter permease [candidate division WWE3 bacterium]
MITYTKTALQSIWNHKVRSVLTVLGVVIGVSSVTILVSLGQGLKNDVSSLIQGFGTNVIVVVAGSIDDSSGGQVNPANFVSDDILTIQDVEDIEGLSDVDAVTPIGLVVGNISKDENQTTGAIFAAYPTLVNAFEVLELEHGQMFSEKTGDVIALGVEPKEKLFGEDSDPVGEKVTFSNRESERELEIVGTFAGSKSTSIFGSEFDNIIAVPFDTAKDLNGGEISINRIVIKASDTADVDAVKDRIKKTMLDNHEGEEDFSVLTQDDLLDLFNQFLNLSTALVSAIAAISLIVGGIGIMNIMLVTVTERTKEIGLRKAVGATKFAIMFQFLIEAIVITFFGGIVGLGISVLTGVIVASQTPLKPDITLETFMIAVGISTVIGVIFGIWPAVRAANKDPIEALRHE